MKTKEQWADEMENDLRPPLNPKASKDLLTAYIGAIQTDARLAGVLDAGKLIEQIGAQ